uniref:COMM domain-containing protein 3 n=1 Tax=Magallana gigas TaxID=29159 RepID=K1QIF4_MAGGI
MELPQSMQDALTLAGESIHIPDAQFPSFVEVAFRGVINSNERNAIENLKEFTSKDPAAVKEAYAGLVAMVIEAAKQDTDIESLSSLLEDCKFPPERIKEVSETYQKNKPALQILLGSVGRTPAHIYRIVEYNSRVTSWKDARDACRRTRGWDLAKIENRQENEALKYLLATECNNGGDGWFIGGRSENGVWKWADNSDMLFDDFPPARSSVNGARPTSTVINYAVIFKGDYQWGYVAPRPTPRMGYTKAKWVEKTSKMTGLNVILGFVTFILIDTASAKSKYRIVDYSPRVSSWEQARAQCRRLGMDLVKIENFREDRALKSLLATECSSTGDGWFIGGRSENGVWKWADNSRMIFQNFPPVLRSYRPGVPSSVVVNYAVIFKEDNQWGYIAPRPPPRMGYICEDKIAC